MSKLDEKIELYKKEVEKLGIDIPEQLLVETTKALGPSIYNVNAEIVSCSSKEELNRVKENFLKKKLGLDVGDEKLNSMLEEVCKKMGSSNRRKYRAIFYSLLHQMVKF